MSAKSNNPVNARAGRHNPDELADALIYLRESVYLLADAAEGHLPAYGEPEAWHNAEEEEVSNLLHGIKATLDDRLERLNLIERDANNRVTHKRAKYSTGIEVWTVYPDNTEILNTPEKYTPHSIKGGAN